MAADDPSRPAGGRRRDARSGGGALAMSSLRQRRPKSTRTRTNMAPDITMAALLVLTSLVHVHAFASTNPASKPPKAATSAIRPENIALQATKLPIRRSGSLFGLFHAPNSGGSNEKEWPVRVVNSTDGSEKVTILDRSSSNKGDDINVGEAASGAGGKNNTGGEEWKVWSSFVGSEMEEAESELAALGTPFLGEAGVPLPLDEEDVAEIAGMLVERPPTLRQLRGNAVGMEEGKGDTGDMDVVAVGAKVSSEGEEGGYGTSSDQGIMSLSERRAQIKAKKAAAAVDLQYELEEVEGKEEATADVGSEASLDLSPAHSIEEDYGQIAAEKEDESSKVDEVKEATDDIKAELSSDDVDTETLPSKPVETPGEKAMKQYESIDVSSSAVSETIVDEKQVDDREDTAVSPNFERMTSTFSLGTDLVADPSEQETSTIGSEDKAKGNPPVVEALGSMFEKAASFLPTPPEAPPTRHNIDHNHDATNENLSEINEGLQAALADQKIDLGKLRKKIHELERELLRAKKTKDKETKRDLEERTAALREEYDGQLERAKETIAALETEGRTLNEELAESGTRLEEALEAKERAAAEYSYAVNLYSRLKGSVDAETAGLSNQLDDSRQEVSVLEAQLANATKRVEKYKVEAKGWRDECTNKANQLDRFTSRVKSMQGTIDDLQSGILDTQKNLDQIIATAKAEEKARSKDNLQRLSDEYEGMMRVKSKKIGKLRTALRSANAKKRHVERFAAKEQRAAVKEVRDRLTSEMDALRGTLKEREDEIRQMEGAVAEAEGAKEEREKLLAEIMFLEKSFEELQAELASNAKMYEDCIQSFEKEAAEKDERIRELEKELEAANETISRLETRIEELTAEVETERSLNANLTATVSDLRSELEVAQKNSGGYDDVVSILKKEAEEYQAQLSQAKGETESLRQKKIELEELMSKTKDSLVDEKNRVTDALEEKDNRIAQLDRELADQLNEIHSSKVALEETKAELKVMTGKHIRERGRANALDAKIAKLNQLSGNANGASSEEVDRLTRLLEEVTKSNEEYKSLSATYEDKVKFLSQQLLLSGQNLSSKQRQIFHMKKELSDATAQAEAKAEAKSSTFDEVTALKARLEEVQSKSTVWKAQANGMIVQLTNDLREKEASVLELQNKLDEKSKEEQSSSDGKSEALEKEIASLKAAMEEAQMKAKEKMKHKNQSLKEMEDTVASLTAQVEDLKREKEQMSDRLNKEVRRGTDDFTSHERQLRKTEERLSKEHLAAMTKLEEEMNQTIQQLQSEIQTLKNKAAKGDGPTTDAQRKKMRQMEEALRRSKDKEVSLISENMKMQHRIEGLQRQAVERSPVATSVMEEEDEEDGDEESTVELPTYFKEKQRPVVIRVVGNAFRKLFRRKKL